LDIGDRVGVSGYGRAMRELADRFRALHVPGSPLLIPNPWDVGSARVLQALGFAALATTSSGFAATLGRLDGTVTRDEAIGHGALVAAGVEVPVSADLENGFADDPDGVAQTVRAAADAGLAGCSIEDWSGAGSYDPAHAAERIAAAAAAADGQIVITARAENYLHERADLTDTIARLQSFAAAGADVLYAPGVVTADDLAVLVREVDRPVNVLALPGAPSVAGLADLGIARISVGGAFAFAALGALAEAGRELLERGTYGFWARAGAGRALAGEAFGG
jgi:2-methylisocitrate lyase-like PEP mutase family enzyme